MASDLIYREDAKDFVRHAYHKGLNPVEYLDEVPAADVRPVIKCKNCRWWTKQEKSLQGRCELGGFYPTGEWFCANGERPNRGADMREVKTNG